MRSSPAAAVMHLSISLKPTSEPLPIKPSSSLGVRSFTGCVKSIFRKESLATTTPLSLPIEPKMPKNTSSLNNPINTSTISVPTPDASIILPNPGTFLSVLLSIFDVSFL